MKIKNSVFVYPSNRRQLIHHALTSARVPVRLEPPGLLRSDGNVPDGVSVAPRKYGKLLVWDTTCADTFAPSYRNLALHAAGAVAAKVEGLKEEKYTDLLHSHEFVQVAEETAGAFELQTMSSVRELGKRLRHQTMEEKNKPH